MENIELTFAEKMAQVQYALKAPKDKSTYAYSYRNAEEILGKVKPLLMNGWEVSGDRNTAWRNNQELTPAIYRQQQAKRSV